MFSALNLCNVELMSPILSHHALVLSRKADFSVCYSGECYLSPQASVSSSEELGSNFPFLMDLVTAWGLTLLVLRVEWPQYWLLCVRVVTYIVVFSYSQLLFLGTSSCFLLLFQIVMSGSKCRLLWKILQETFLILETWNQLSPQISAHSSSVLPALPLPPPGL